MNARLTLAAAGTFALALLLLPGLSRADCGPGPLVFKSSKGIIQQIIGFSINVTFVPIYALGVTTGTSGCSNSGVVEGDQAAREFVAVSADSVDRSVAQGRGEYVTVLASLMGCPQAARAEFAQRMQAHYPELSADPQAAPGQWVAQVRAQLEADPALAARCTRAG